MQQQFYKQVYSRLEREKGLKVIRFLYDEEVFSLLQLVWTQIYSWFIHRLSHGLWRCHYQDIDMIRKFPRNCEDPTLDLGLKTDSHVFFDLDIWCGMMSADLWIMKSLSENADLLWKLQGVL